MTTTDEDRDPQLSQNDPSEDVSSEAASPGSSPPEDFPSTRDRPEKIGFAARFFLFCAGSDLGLLDTAAERTKHVGLGTLVVVPAVLASFAMTYAISTLTENLYIPILAGLAWALIVFCFDRYIVSTFRKSSSVGLDLVSPVFLVRIVLAGFIGLIVAHPLVLLYFEDSIDQQLRVERGNSQQLVEASFQPRFESIENSRAALRQEIQEKEQIRLEAQAILMEEIGGIDSGRTTGQVGRGPAARAQEELRDMAEQDLVVLRGELAAQDEALAAEWANLSELRQQQRLAPQARDYIARAKALETLRSQSLELVRVHAFLILFFVFVDTLPVIFKALTPRGPYDEKLALQEMEATEQVTRDRWKLRSVYQAVDAARASSSGRREAELRGLPNLYGELVRELETHQTAFRSSLRRETGSSSEGLTESQQASQEKARDLVDAANLRVMARTVEQFEEAFLGTADSPTGSTREGASLGGVSFREEQAAESVPG